MRWLVTGARKQGLSVNATTIAWGQGTTHVLAAAQLTALAPVLNPGDQLRYRIGTPMPRRPSTRLRESRAGRGRRVPTMLWPEWSLRFAIPDCYQRQLRPRSVNGAVVRRYPGPAAGRRRSARQPDSRAIRATRAAQATSVRPLGTRSQALIRLADYLDTTDTPIDYQRRRHLDYSGLLPPAEWAPHLPRHRHTRRNAPRQHERAVLPDRTPQRNARQAPRRSPRTTSKPTTR